MRPLIPRLQALPATRLRAPAVLSACVLACALAAPAGATVYSALQLSALPADSAQLLLPGDAGEPSLTITELGVNGLGTMTGSGLFGYPGLWLGAAGLDGHYSFAFSQPVASLRISFVALSAFESDGQASAETITGFATDQPSGISFISADGSARWDGVRVTPLGDDGRGVLWVQSVGAGFTFLQFAHLQPEPLNGFVLDRIEYGRFVPEPSAANLALAGLLLLLFRLKKAPRIQGACASQSCAFVSR